MDKIVNNFIIYIKRNIDDILKNNLYIYNEYIILWNSDYIYEEADTYDIVNKPNDDKEYITYKTKDVLNHQKFKEFLTESYYKLNLEIDKNLIFIKPITNEFNDEMENLSLLFENIQVINKNNSDNARKMSLIINGKLFLNPNREYWINFTNNHEYVVHCYELDSYGKREKMLFYFFKEIKD